MDLGQVEYVIVDREDFNAEARLNGICIGYVHCVRDGERLRLSDIVVLDEMPRVRLNILERLRSLVGGRGKQQLRHQGIGSELLRRVLWEADSVDIRETWGSVTRDDLKNQPTLLRWYERHGFVIQEPDSECLKNATKKIVRRREWETS